MNKTITKNERLQLIGLMILARKYQKMVNECDQAMNEITGTEEGPLLSDAIYDDRDIKYLLQIMGVEVA